MTNEAEFHVRGYVNIKNKFKHTAKPPRVYIIFHNGTRYWKKGFLSTISTILYTIQYIHNEWYNRKSCYEQYMLLAI